MTPLCLSVDSSLSRSFFVSLKERWSQLILENLKMEEILCVFRKRWVRKLDSEGLMFLVAGVKLLFLFSRKDDLS